MEYNKKNHPLTPPLPPVSEMEEGGGGESTMECSAKLCKSCTAGLIADCVALCCCPCAVLHCFALAFVKAPWVVGRRCFRLGKKSWSSSSPSSSSSNNKKKKTLIKHNKRRCKCSSSTTTTTSSSTTHDFDAVAVVQSTSSETNDVVVVGRDDELESVTVNAGFEADEVWLELYQIAHLDFGRISFSDQHNE
ncbi:uncharacterized protein LOC130981226 [Arachis stenosperma]|uniref:uncharacterized protein LOC130981226 n=1 Tax=Arachis stenosperma TaxID=217475 RepID=UPI0025ABACDA|nr:uncharacterized protein LOC130981226 [Arachis stenosperma]